MLMDMNSEELIRTLWPIWYLVVTLDAPKVQTITGSLVV